MNVIAHVAFCFSTDLKTVNLAAKNTRHLQDPVKLKTELIGYCLVIKPYPVAGIYFPFYSVTHQIQECKILYTRVGNTSGWLVLSVLDEHLEILRSYKVARIKIT